MPDFLAAFFLVAFFLAVFFLATFRLAVFFLAAFFLVFLAGAALAPAIFLPLAVTDTCQFAAVRHRELPLYGLQFHPEVTHTPHGSKILGNFLSAVCKCSGTWKLGDFARETIDELRRRVGDRRVICGLSGGVDSTVVAALLAQAIGEQLACILVDNGLLRKDEEEAVIAQFSDHFKTDLHVVPASDRFLGELAGVVAAPEGAPAR